MRSWSSQTVCCCLACSISDVSLGIPAESINESNSILCISREVFIKHHVFHNVPLDGLVDRLVQSPRLPRQENCVPGWQAGISPEIFEPYAEDERIRVRHLIHVLNDFVEPA